MAKFFDTSYGNDECPVSEAAVTRDKLYRIFYCDGVPDQPKYAVWERPRGDLDEEDARDEASEMSDAWTDVLEIDSDEEFDRFYSHLKSLDGLRGLRGRRGLAAWEDSPSSTPRGRTRFKIVKEKEPYSRTGFAYRAYRIDESGEWAEGVGGETEDETRERLLSLYPEAEFEGLGAAKSRLITHVRDSRGEKIGVSLEKSYSRLGPKVRFHYPSGGASGASYYLKTLEEDPRGVLLSTEERRTSAGSSVPWSIDAAEVQKIMKAATGRQAPRRGVRPGMVEVRELELYAENEEPLYRLRLQIEKGLVGKLARGQYSRDKAHKAFKYYADRAAQMYTREFDVKGRTSFGAFSKAEREALARREERQFFARVQAQDPELIAMVPKKYKKGETCEVRRTNGTFKLDCNIDLRGMSRRRRSR